MLTELEIENLAVISYARIPFHGMLNVFTGETGAGKSILLHGIHAVLGQRMSKDIVRTGCKKATVTALFTDLTPTVIATLDELNISHEDDEILLTREISADGRSTARVNGHIANVSVLRELGNVLINIHGQHDNQVLLSADNHLSILDEFGGDSTLLNSYRESFYHLQHIAKELKALRTIEQEKQQRRERLEILINDVEELDLAEQEEDTIAEQLEVLENAEEIRQALIHTQNLLTEEADCVTDKIRSAGGELNRYSDLQEQFLDLEKRLQAVTIELEDISDACRTLEGTIEADPMEQARLQARLDQIRQVCRIYNCTSEDLLENYKNAKEEIDAMESNISRIAKLVEEKNQLLLLVTQKAEALTTYRKDLLERFTKQVTEQLEFLNMPDVQLQGVMTEGKLTVQGKDSVEFLISANRGEEPRPLAKIASGGELSRIMLALKCVIADRDKIPTLIFDEIDTGVSGKAAQKIGRKLQEVAGFRQVLCVTHLAQIAVMADHHILIEKTSETGHTETHVTVLEEEERVAEIARIMGGENPSALILESAREEIGKYHRSEEQA